MGFKGKLSKYFFSNEITYYFFFSNSDRDFYSENNNVSQVYLYTKNSQKKGKKRYYRLCSILR
jgi:hypothetical protein